MIDSIDYEDMLKYLRLRNEEHWDIKEVLNSRISAIKGNLEVRTLTKMNTTITFVVSEDEYLKWTILQDLKKEVEK